MKRLRRRYPRIGAQLLWNLFVVMADRLANATDRENMLTVRLNQLSKGLPSKAWGLASREPDALRGDRILACSLKGTVSLAQLRQQRLRVDQILRLEAFAEPVVDGSEEVTGLDFLALVQPVPGEAGSGAELEISAALALCDRD